MLPQPDGRRVLVLRARVADGEGWRPWVRGTEADRGAFLPDRRERAIIGPAVTRWYLSRLLGCEPDDVPILQRGLAERPDLDRPRLPDRWRDLPLARTRAPGRSWVAFAMGPLLGIDVEVFDGPRKVALSTFLDTLPPSFAAEVGAAPEPDRWRRAVECWTRYEAWAKASGTGVTLYPADPPAHVRFRAFDPGAGLVGSVATLHEVESVTMVEVRPPEQRP